MQKSMLYAFLLLPLFIIFVIGSIAENNRAPFDLAEAESELVSGFMTEHAASIFVFFFLGEYGSIILMCILISIIFLGGYDMFFIINELYNIIINIVYIICNNILLLDNTNINNSLNIVFNNNTIYLLSLIYTGSLAFKTCILIFIYI